MEHWLFYTVSKQVFKHLSNKKVCSVEREGSVLLCFNLSQKQPYYHYFNL